VTEERELPAGSLVVRLNQRSNKVILELLEPDARDSLVSWGYFDAIFEEKESPEDYILEKLATGMLQNNPTLKTEFEARLLSDPDFKANPRARLRFFYERSPYWERHKNAYPVVRITRPDQIPRT
jgi:hypothetical protein